VKRLPERGSLGGSGGLGTVIARKSQAGKRSTHRLPFSSMVYIKCMVTAVLMCCVRWREQKTLTVFVCTCTPKSAWEGHPEIRKGNGSNFVVSGVYDTSLLLNAHPALITRHWHLSSDFDFRLNEHPSKVLFRRIRTPALSLSHTSSQYTP
jgi:hypothetical protein